MTHSPASAPVPARIAAVQMVSGPRVADNLKTAAHLVGEAVAQGATLVALPEYFPIIGAADADKVAARERDAEEGGGGPIQDFLAEAAARKSKEIKNK